MFGNIKKRQDYAMPGGSRTLKGSVFIIYDRQERLKTSSAGMKEEIPTEEDIEKTRYHTSMTKMEL